MQFPPALAQIAADALALAICHLWRGAPASAMTSGLPGSQTAAGRQRFEIVRTSSLKYYLGGTSGTSSATKGKLSMMGLLIALEIQVAVGSSSGSPARNSAAMDTEPPAASE